MPAAHLIYNPAAGRGRHEGLLPRLLEALALHGWKLTPAATGAAGAATGLARSAVEAGAKVVFALGGDGHLREVAKGLLGTGTALAPLPGGTINVVARELGVPKDPVVAARRYRPHQPLLLDVGLCGDEPFLMQATAGLDAAALRRVPTGAKRRLGQLAVLAAGLGAWWQYDYREIWLDADGESQRANWIAVCNLSRYAGNLRLGEVGPTDRRLELVVLRGASRRATLAFALALLAGQHRRLRDVALRTVREVVLHAPLDLPLQLDGDPVALAPPLTVRLHPRQLGVLLPAPEGMR